MASGGVSKREQGETRRIIEEALAQGSTIEGALDRAGRSRFWYDDHRRRDPEWAKKLDGIREHAKAQVRKPVPDFPEFCERYLGMKLWPHQLNLFDVLEGRPPRWLHPSMTYEPGTMGAGRVLINMPPGHTKTMTVSISYTLWRILQDPTMTVLVISKTRDFASKILWAIKQRLTSPRYADLQLAFGPVEGFREASDQWAATKIYLGGDNRDSQEKDPTLEATGIGGQIYGNRARLILIDDSIVLSNASQWEGQQDWIRQEVASRIGPDDQLIVVGTRVAPVDLYRELRNPDHYHDSVVPWTYFSMPAVLEYAEKPQDWVTLWPISDIPFSDTDIPNEDGLFARWTGSRLARVRNEVGPRRWSLVYQQQDISDESIFDPVCVRGSIDGMRGAGQPLTVGAHGGPDQNARLYTIVGVDPAIKGNAAFSCLTVDTRSGRRWLIDMQVITAPSPKQIREKIMAMVEKYHPQEVRVEANAYQGAITKDETLTKWLAGRGVTLKPHLTYANKTDPAYGVASMSMLFGTVRAELNRTVHNGDNMISLPNQSVPGMKMLVDELITWDPSKSTRNLRQDTVMALWIANIRADELTRTQDRASFQQGNKFLSRQARGRQMTVSLSDMASARSGNVSYL